MSTPTGYPPLVVNRHTFDLAVAEGYRPEDFIVSEGIEKMPRGWREPSVYPQTLVRADRAVRGRR
jgi:hypothetical protein